LDDKKKKLDEASKHRVGKHSYNISAVVSSSELTGITPSLPVSEGSLEAYAQLYSVPAPEDLDEEKQKKEK